MSEFRRHRDRAIPTNYKSFWKIYLLSVLFTFHFLLVAYINSTYMEQYLPPEAVGILFAIGSGLAVVAFMSITRVLEKIGNVPLTLTLAAIDIAALITLGLTSTPIIAIIAFIIFMAVSPLLFLNIDIFSESLIGDNEAATGSQQGLSLTLKSLAAFCAPLAMGLLVSNDENLAIVYFAAAAVFSVFILLVLTSCRNFKDPVYTHIRFVDLLRELWQKNDIRNVLSAHFLLQLFFAWAVIYIPLYLSVEVGMDWNTISYILSAGLFAYVLLEWPVGIIADKWLGEKELMAVGFLVLTVSTATIAFMAGATIIAWACLVFTTRIGAALIETTTESYFFKHTKSSDAELIGFFRLLRPLSIVLGSVLGSLTLLFVPFNLAFVVLAGLMIPGFFFTAALHDTK